MRYILTTLLVAALVPAAMPTAVGAQAPTTDQQKCINGMNKTAGKLVKVLGKELETCMKRGEAGGLGAPDLETCMLQDVRGKIGKIRAKLLAVEAKSCQTSPPFAFTGAAGTDQATTDGMSAFGAALFGVDWLGVPLADTTTCRSRVIKRSNKLLSDIYKAFAKCKKDGLKLGAFSTPEELASCFDDVAADPKGKLQKDAAKLTLDAIGECPAGTALTLFPGLCALSPGPLSLAGCVASQTRCEACLAIGAADALTGDCDTFDDGTVNGSCLVGPTTTTTTTSTTTTSTTTTTSSTTTTTLGDCASAAAPVCAGSCPIGEGCFDQGGSCACVPTTTTTSTTTTSTTSSTTSTTIPGPPVWPPDQPTFASTAGPTSYINSLTLPPVVSGVATCCKDFGAISKDFIEGGTNEIDNALAVLAGALSGLGIDIQMVFDDSLAAGSLVLLLDHRDLDFGSLPDPFFALVQLFGEFDAGTTFTEADAGTGDFLLQPESFVGATGEPLNFDFPSNMGLTDMAAGPFTFGLNLPLGFVTLDLQAFDTEVVADHGTITAAGVPYTNGELAAYVLVDDIFGAINALLNAQCACLGHSSDIYTESGGTWSGACVNGAGTCTSPDDDLCIQLGAGLGDGGFCPLLPGVLQGQSDIDLNSDPSVYEGLSIGIQFTATTANITGIAP